MKFEDINTINEMFIFKENEHAGMLVRTKNGSDFVYQDEYLERMRVGKAKQLAFGINALEKTYSTTGINLHPFFAGLLPEGLRLTALISALKTSADDLFSLLLASGRDVIGDVFASDSLEIKHKKIATTKLDSAPFFDLFKESISARDYASRLIDPSIPGVQAKVSAQMISFPVEVKQRNKRYILKLETEAFPQIIKNEHFFMNLARDCGIEAAKTAIVHDKDNNPGLLVERFDRIYEKSRKALTSLHQEDACQFLSRYPQDKYRLSLREIANGMENFCSSPIIEISKLLEIKAFSYMIGNGDLHAKNISLLTDRKTNRVALSPAYDILTTLPYGDQTMALHLEGKKSNLKLKDFIAFGKRFGVRENVTEKKLNKIAKVISQKLDQIHTLGFTQKKSTFIEKTISSRISQFR